MGGTQLTLLEKSKDGRHTINSAGEIKDGRHTINSAGEI